MTEDYTLVSFELRIDSFDSFPLLRRVLDGVASSLSRKCLSVAARANVNGTAPDGGENKAPDSGMGAGWLSKSGTLDALPRNELPNCLSCVVDSTLSEEVDLWSAFLRRREPLKKLATRENVLRR
eukprot:m.364183 g.364183  ORF g.364183 m.364183 type:complete len:125 (+) comp25902_c0_seq1:221-595(+)